MESSKCKEPGSDQVRPCDGTGRHSYTSHFPSAQQNEVLLLEVAEKGPDENPPVYNPAVKSKCCGERKTEKRDKCPAWTGWELYSHNYTDESQPVLVSFQKAEPLKNKQWWAQLCPWARLPDCSLLIFSPLRLLWAAYLYVMKHFINVNSDTEQSLMKIQNKARGLLCSFSLSNSYSILWRLITMVDCFAWGSPGWCH